MPFAPLSTTIAAMLLTSIARTPVDVEHVAKNLRHYRVKFAGDLVARIERCKRFGQTRILVKRNTLRSGDAHDLFCKVAASHRNDLRRFGLDRIVRERGCCRTFLALAKIVETHACTSKVEAFDSPSTELLGSAGTTVLSFDSLCRGATDADALATR